MAELPQVASATPQPRFARPPLGEPTDVGWEVWAKLGLAVALTALAVAVVPRGWDGEGTVPPVASLVTTGAVVGLAGAAALWWILRGDLGFPARVAVLAVAYNALVVAVKFVLAPHGLYEVNQKADLSAVFALDDWVGAAMAAALVFLLYGLAYVVIYAVAVPRRRVGGRVRAAFTPRRLAITAVVGFLLLTGFGGVLVLLLIPLIFVGTGLEYLDFVFSSGVSALVALLLAAAAGLAALAFRAAAASPAVVGDAALLASFFWVGLAFLAAYHALWVVYLLVLTALWPLRVVVPK